MEKLIDIKDFTQVDDSSFYLFLALCVLAAFILVFLTFKILKFFKLKAKSKKQKAKEALKNIDFTDSKHTAYKISKFAPFITESEAQKGLLNELLKTLEKYKYQKNVPPFNEDDKLHVKMFLEACDV